MTRKNSALKDDARLDAYFADEGERRSVTRKMFDEAAAGYGHADRITALGSGWPGGEGALAVRAGYRHGLRGHRPAHPDPDGLAAGR
jgi:demethylmenaquinone methyltransferase/2-methoxy-6-polyprenyl-1,4-benzoquinol methylase